MMRRRIYASGALLFCRKYTSQKHYEEQQRQLLRETCDNIYRSSSAREQLRQLIHESSVENALRHLSEFAQDASVLKTHSTFASISSEQDDLSRIADVLKQFGPWYVARKAPAKVTMHEPWDWYPKARFMRRRFFFHHGPTNSGKTHAALEALIRARSGVYCAPLKALAAQVWKRIDATVPCDLLIGDERRFGGGAEHVSCTVEMTPIDYQVDVGVIDEVQMIADRDRGWAWTRALLGLPAREIHLCGEPRALRLIRGVLYKTHEMRRLDLVPHDRLVPLEVSPPLDGDLTKVENGDCLVCFSRKAVFDFRRRLERIPGVVPHCIYGSMPFAVREAQAEAFNNGVHSIVTGATSVAASTRHVLISTDAIAYGLNMSIERMIFAAMRKYDGHGMVPLPQTTVLQVAGRAGRFGLARANPMGRCTTLHSGEDFAALRDAMGGRLPPLERAGLLPTADILELFVGLRATSAKEKGHAEVPFSERVKEFAHRCKTTELFFPCDVSRSLLQVATELEPVRGLTLSDRILFCYVPLSERSRETLHLLRDYAKDHAAGRPVALRVDKDFAMLEQLWEKSRGNMRESQRLLEQMEKVYRQAEMYCWLAWRFGKTFVHLEEGSALKQRASMKMSEMLQSL